MMVRREDLSVRTEMVEAVVPAFLLTFSVLGNRVCVACIVGFGLRGRVVLCER